jgi:multiple antibiotic resistance protein
MELFRAEWTYFTGAFVTLFFIVDPFATVPLYVAMTERFTPADRRHIRRKASFVALLLMLGFAVTGMKFFELFGITLPAFQIAGGLLLVLLGAQQLTSEKKRVSSEEADESQTRDDVSIFPLATPLLAGPGAISTVILLATEAPTVLRRATLVLAVLTCMACAYAILAASTMLSRVLGRTGLNLVSRLMGIVLTAVAVQFILNGIRDAVLRFKS